MASFKREQLHRLRRRRRHVELEIAGGDDIAGAQFAEPHGVGRRARKAEVEPLQQIDDRIRQIAPALQRALRQPAIDQDHRHAALGGFDHQIRPQIGFHEQRQIRPPMVEKTAHVARHIERHELMDDAARQPVLGEFARGDGAGGHQHGDAAVGDEFDQRQHARQFADAGAMQPDQRNLRPRDEAFAAPFGQPRAMLLAALEAARQEQRRQRRHRRRQQPVGAQSGWQRLVHDCSFRSAIA